MAEEKYLHDGRQSPAVAPFASGLDSPPENHRTALHFVLIFVLLAVGIVAAGYVHYRNYERQYSAQIGLQMSSVASLKVDELMLRRKELLGDAAGFLQNVPFGALVSRALGPPEDLEAQQQLRDWLGQVRANRLDYSRVFLVDALGAERMSVPDGLEPPVYITLENAAAVLRGRKVSFLDLHRDRPDGPIRLNILIPLFDPSDTNRPLGVLAFRVDPAIHIFPLIQRWPTPSQTAETLLVRRDGRNVLYLNDLRFQTNAALRLRVPLKKTEVPAVRAVLGQVGVMRGEDYRGVPVIAAAHAVPDSPWYIVAKMDVEEAFAPLRAQLRQLAGTVIALLFAAAAAMSLVWRQQRLRFYRERARATELLRTSEDKFKCFFSRSSVGMSITRFTGEIEVNQAFCDMLGYSEEELKRRTWQSITHPGDVELTQRFIDGLHAGGQDSAGFSKRFLHKNGSVVWVDLSSSLRRDSAGQPLYMMTALFDITERKRAEEALRRSEARFRESMDNLLEGCQIIGFDWRFLYLNDVAATQGRKPKEAFLGRTMMEVLPGIESTELFTVLKRCMAGREPQYMVNEFDYSTGVQGWFELRIQPSEEGIFILSIDITERKTAELAQSKLQAQLVQAQKMESVGRLAGGVAHDFNNLLMGILNYVELCCDMLPADHPVRGYLNEVTADAERSVALTRQLLAFARKQTIEPKVLDLSETVAGTLKLLRRLLGENINLTMGMGSGLWPVRLDASQLDQILTNLCVNARDAIAGVGRLSIGTANVAVDRPYCDGHADAIPGDYVVLSVSDTGHGMAKEVLEHIFEPFFTTKEVGKGTGLGLATVYGIVKQNRGFITVYSEPGRGTTFKIHLPRCSEQVQENVRPSERPAIRPGGHETILLVEDEKSVRVTTTQFLKKAGYNVLEAENPELALHLAAQHAGEIDLLITDVVMPGMSGRDLAARLSALRPGVKCLYISGFTADIIAQEGILVDGLLFMTKPFSRDELVRKVSVVLDSDKETLTVQGQEGELDPGRRIDPMSTPTD